MRLLFQAMLGIGAAIGQRSRMIGNEVADVWDWHVPADYSARLEQPNVAAPRPILGRVVNKQRQLR